jgi:hypothetical protein
MRVRIVKFEFQNEVVVKQRESALQLEVMIKKAVGKAMPPPKNLSISIWPDGDTWRRSPIALIRCRTRCFMRRSARKPSY